MSNVKNPTFTFDLTQIHVVSFQCNQFNKYENTPILRKGYRGSAGHDRMIVGFTNSFAISVYHQYSCELESR
jgi:hypothetical protein